MKNIFFYKIALLLICIFIFSCKVDNKTEKKKEIIGKLKKEKHSTNKFELVDNVSMEIYGPYNNVIGYDSIDDYIINIKKNNPYVKYKIRPIDKNISRSSMKDSVFLSGIENDHIANFFLIKNGELKASYWDGISEGRVRRIYFLNQDITVVKNVNIIGEPHNIDYLKESCDFLLEKVKMQEPSK